MGEKHIVRDYLNLGLDLDYVDSELTKTSDQAKFVCLERVPKGCVESTLWGGELSDGSYLYIASILAPLDQPHYDKGFADADEARLWFSRQVGRLQ